MSSMSFMPELKQFLMRNGLIYTVRKYKMLRAIVEVEDVGLCDRLPLGEVSGQADLVPYAEYSGFQSVEDWWSMVRHFVPDKENLLYLYEVKLR